ncbi:hypothetical protein EYR40_009896 [Pleurotus pulmonarius]|nr:hypothetical protein EYR40_009896 [Pleurotus pulmonarius]
MQSPSIDEGLDCKYGASTESGEMSADMAKSCKKHKSRRTDDSDCDLPIATSDDSYPPPTQSSRIALNGLPRSSPPTSSENGDEHGVEGNTSREQGFSGGQAAEIFPYSDIPKRTDGTIDNGVFLEGFATLLGLNRFTDVQQAWKGVFASIGSRRTIGGPGESLAYRGFHNAVVTADFYMRELCRILELIESARRKQLNSIRWPLTLIPLSRDVIDDDLQDLYEPEPLDVFQVLKVVAFFIRRFRMKTPADPPVEDSSGLIYPTFPGGANGKDIPLTPEVAFQALKEPKKYPGIMFAGWKTAADVLMSMDKHTTCPTHFAQGSPIQNGHARDVEGLCKLNCGCPILTSLLELWIEKAAAASGVPVCGDAGVTLERASWTTERLWMTQAAMEEVSGLDIQQLFLPLPERMDLTMMWAFKRTLKLRENHKASLMLQRSFELFVKYREMMEGDE